VYLVISVVAFGIVVAIGWRLASRRQSIPCPVWLRWLVEIDNPFTRISRAAIIAEHLDLEPGMVVLDFGCGPGRVTLPVARLVGDTGKVVAIDIQEGMLARAQQKALGFGLSNIEFIQSAAGEGKLDHDRFDRALLVSVLGEIPDRKAALAEIFDALKPSGILSVTEVIFDPHFQSRALVTRLAIKTGFREHAFFGNRIAYTLNLQKPTAQ
jgi:ubiquinone/menaquinone biosynthesis C-methylase UbiE